MKTITTEEFRADPAAAWREAERLGEDIILVGKDGERRGVLHLMRDPDAQHWTYAQALSHTLIEDINGSAIDTNEKQKLTQQLRNIWRALLPVNNWEYCLDEPEEDDAP